MLPTTQLHVYVNLAWIDYEILQKNINNPKTYNESIQLLVQTSICHFSFNLIHEQNDLNLSWKLSLLN